LATIAGLVAVATVMALSALVHLLASSIPFLPLAIAQVLVRTTSGGVDSFFIERLGHWASRLAVGGTCLAFFLAGGVLGRIMAGANNGGRAILLGPLAMAPLFAASAVLYPAAPQYAPRWEFALVAATIYAVAGVAGGLAYGRMRWQPTPAATDQSRRYFLASLGVGGVAAAAGVLNLGGLLRRTPDPGLQRLALPNVKPVGRPPSQPGDEAFAEIPSLSPEITPTSRFYVVNEELVYPRLDASTWRLSVGGAVDRPVDLTYDGLKRLPAVERFQTMECISNEVGDEYISTAKFTGVPVREILERAGVQHGVVEVVFGTSSGYADSIPIGLAMEPTTLIVLGINDHALPTEHGFPARLLALGNYGMKNPKWLTSMTPVRTPYQGFWERRGWSKPATIRTMSRIDVPGSGTRAPDVPVVAGIAFGGDRGISKVEVSPDGERTWRPAILKSELSPDTWRLWRYHPAPGELRPGATLAVRAYDGGGAVQARTPEEPFPRGSSGYHTVELG
jgi:DMSO/TMAO reductase YedYZ molybdopterin-dependent catalytic subunit